MPRDIDKEIKRRLNNFDDRIQYAPREDIKKLYAKYTEIFEESVAKFKDSNLKIADTIPRINDLELDVLKGTEFIFESVGHAKSGTNNKIIQVSLLTLKLLKDYQIVVNSKSLSDTVIVLYKQFFEILEVVRLFHLDGQPSPYRYIHTRSLTIATDGQFKSEVRKPIKVSKSADLIIFNIKQVMRLNSNDEALLYLLYFVICANCIEMPE
jgi:hypothetical protein